VLFTYIYPGEAHRIPRTVMSDLIERLLQQPQAQDDARLCRGGLLSRAAYVVDLMDWGYTDARLTRATMSEAELEKWTAAAPDVTRANANGGVRVDPKW
jgi:hypothetical protein